MKAPEQGWASGRTIGELAGALALLAAFVLNEQRGANPLIPLSIFRVKGLAAADITQLIALAGFISRFFFLTLYMQNVLGYSPLKTGAAYLPLCAGVAVSAGISSKLIARIGTRAPHHRRRGDRRRGPVLPGTRPRPRLLPHRPVPRPDGGIGRSRRLGRVRMCWSARIWVVRAVRTKRLMD